MLEEQTPSGGPPGRPLLGRVTPSAVLGVLAVVCAVIAVCCAIPIAWNSMFASRGPLRLQAEFVHEHLGDVFVREQRLGVVAFFAGIAMLIAGSVAPFRRVAKDDERDSGVRGISAASLLLLVAGGIATAASLVLQPGSAEVRDAQKLMATATRNDQQVATRAENGTQSEIGSLLAWTRRLEKLAGAAPCLSRCSAQVELLEITAEIKKAMRKYPDAKPGFEKVRPRVDSLWRALQAAIEGLSTGSGDEVSPATTQKLMRPLVVAALLACRAWSSVHLTPPDVLAESSN